MRDYLIVPNFNRCRKFYRNFLEVAADVKNVWGKEYFEKYVRLTIGCSVSMATYLLFQEKYHWLP